MATIEHLSGLALAYQRRGGDPFAEEVGEAIGAGSDLPAAPGMYPGWGLHQELEALVHLGMTPTEALRAATWGAAELAGRDDIGELSAAARADVVVVAGDPTREITDTRWLEAVWFGGEPVELDLAWERVIEALEAAAAAFGGSGSPPMGPGRPVPETAASDPVNPWAWADPSWPGRTPPGIRVASGSDSWGWACRRAPRRSPSRSIGRQALGRRLRDGR